MIKKNLKWLGKFFGTTVFGFFAIWQILIVVSLIIFGVIAFLPEHSTEKNQKNLGGVQEVYSDGRKTIESFGTRKEFAILRFSNREYEQDAPRGVRWSLYDRDKNKSIDSDVERYNCISPYLYTKGEKGYTKLNYKTSEIEQSGSMSEFSKEDQEIFEKLDAGKGRAKQ